MPKIIIIRCPSCLIRVQIGADSIGQEVECHNCQHSFVVEEPPPRPPSPWSRMFLTVGQIVTALSCIFIAVATPVQFVMTLQAHPMPGVIGRTMLAMLLLVGGVISFCVSAALFVTFGRVKAFPNVIKQLTDECAELRKLVTPQD